MTNKEQLLKKISEKILAIERAKNFYNEREMTGIAVKLQDASKQLSGLQKEIEESSPNKGIFSLFTNVINETNWDNRYFKIVDQASEYLMSYSMFEARYYKGLGNVARSSDSIYKPDINQDAWIKINKKKDAEQSNENELNQEMLNSIEVVQQMAGEITGRQLFSTYKPNQGDEEIEMKVLPSRDVDSIKTSLTQ